MKWLDDVFAIIGVVVDSQTEKKESSVNSMTPSIMPLQAQEQRRTSQDSQRLREHLDKQFESHAQNNAMLMHKGDCDIFVCTGCDERTSDKIVSEVYEIDSYRPRKCQIHKCEFLAQRSEQLCNSHIGFKCAVKDCFYEKNEDWPLDSEFCLTHTREFQVSKWSGNESRNSNQT